MKRLKIRRTHLRGIFVFFLLVLPFCLIMPPSVLALESAEVLVIANKNAAHSVKLAKYYMERRGIPAENFLKLSMTDKEWCSREDYEQKVVSVVRDHLGENDPAGNIRCLVTMYGLPLRVRPPEMTRDEKKQLQEIKKKKAPIREELQSTPKDQLEKRERLIKRLKALSRQGVATAKSNYRASFDSELSLVLAGDYLLNRWIPNPYFVGFKNKKLSILREEVLMVSRLDGPSVEIVKRIIDDSIKAEENGLKGKAYFDAKGPRQTMEKAAKSSSGQYELSLYLAADRVEKSKLMPVSINNSTGLFQSGECPDAALYCGWYSRKNYIDAFDWQPGAVGYHIASDECTTLKNKKSRVWCKMMLEDGIAATLGPVSEPYLTAFPLPEIFFGLLVDGRLTLGECYMLSLPYLSWQMVLVGDPLYRPFIGKSDERLKR